MKQTVHSNQKSRLFFLEFLIVLFFFLIISTVCIRIFAQSRMMTERAEALSRAQAAASSTAEVLIAENGNIKKAAQILGSTSVSDNSFQFISDDQIVSCEVSAEVSAESSEISISVKTASQEQLYHLAFELHVPLTREEVLP